MTSTIPACRDCKHYYNANVGDDVFVISTCRLYYNEIPDYIRGNVERINMLCINVRQNEERCGYEGKNFEQREVPVEIPRVSKRTQLKNFINKIWKYFSRYSRYDIGLI